MRWLFASVKLNGVVLKRRLGSEAHKRHMITASLRAEHPSEAESSEEGVLFKTTPFNLYSDSQEIG